MRSQRALLACLFFLMMETPFSCLADTKTYTLPDGATTFRPGPGRDVIESNCLACHSSDYISTQPPGLGKKFWEAEVNKMKKVYGAQFSEQDATAIINYLDQYY